MPVLVLIPVLILGTGPPGEFFQAIYGIVHRIRLKQ
jgi:hypothetical protein